MGRFNENMLAELTTDNHEVATSLMDGHGHDLIKLFSWGGVSAGLASGVLSYVGGELFKNAFNVPTLEGVINRAAEELKEYIHAQFESNFLFDCDRRVAALYALLREYHNSPETSQHRLDYIDLQSNELMYLLYGRSVDAFFVYVLAVVLKVAVLYARYENTKMLGELQNIKEIVGSSQFVLGEAVEKLQKNIDVHVGDVYEVSTESYVKRWIPGRIREHQPAEPVLGWRSTWAFNVANVPVCYTVEHNTREGAVKDAMKLASDDRVKTVQNIQQKMKNARELIMNPCSRVRDDLEKIKLKVDVMGK